MKKIGRVGTRETGIKIGTVESGVRRIGRNGIRSGKTGIGMKNGLTTIGISGKNPTNQRSRTRTRGGGGIKLGVIAGGGGGGGALAFWGQRFVAIFVPPKA